MRSMTNAIVKTGERLQARVVQHCWGRMEGRGGGVQGSHVQFSTSVGWQQDEEKCGFSGAGEG